MNKKKILKVAQNFIGMTPNDLGCENWSEMQEKFADELVQLDVPYIEEYYIQSGYIGNAMCWWGKDHRGYTAHFENAGRYSKKDAMKIINDSSNHECAWLCSHVDNCKEAQVITIEGQSLNTDFRITAKKK